MDPALMVLIAFVFCLGAFHVMWVFLYPKPAVFWHVVDYVWLAVALAAVVPQLLDIQRRMAEYDQGISGVDAYFALHRLRVHAAAARACADERGVEERSVCRWKETVQQRFAEDLPDSPRSFGGVELPPAPSVRSPSARAEVARVMAAHREYMTEIGRWRTAFWRAQPSDLSNVFLVASPFLLVFAVALRATKVSAQIRKEWPHPGPATPPADPSAAPPVDQAAGKAAAGDTDRAPATPVL